MTSALLLSDAKLRALKPKKKSYQVFDGQGLYIEVTSSGSKLWRVQKMLKGKVFRRALGRYPYVGLKEAREKADSFVKSCLTGKIQNKISSLQTFGQLCEVWQKKFNPQKSPKTIRTLLSLLRAHILPVLNKVNLCDINPQFLLHSIIHPIELQNKIPIANMVKTTCSQILRYGVILGVVDRDYTLDLKGALSSSQTKHRAAITDPSKIAKLLKDIYEFKGNISLTYALRLLPYLFLRVGELTGGKWAEIDFEGGLWRLPPEKMKMKRPHLVPLAPQVISMLKELQVFTGKSKFLFPSSRNNNKINKDSLLQALRTMGYTKDELTAHGFRGMASTILNEQGFNPDWIELQLAHVPGGVRAAYNHATYLKERRQMMEAWANYLDNLRDN
ncbi:MAG: tyrosine-type recombinase/integrase [Deltaproteobacteria bacterium]|jgi:integrase|nr:tyrosine-type recombinase/integrase [Deltaproteobacteria bacterium]